jgi:O-antigen/teichoic acid export membrane protein
MGLQAQVWLNGIVALLALVRFGGATLVLVLLSPTVKAFFVWQAGVSVFECAVLMLKVKRELPATTRAPSFSMAAIRNTWQFTKGMAATSILVLILTQIDKLLLSKVLTLEEFGRYTLAATIAGALAIFFSPISAAIYPQFTALYTQQRESELIEAYHNAAQLLTTLLTPAALMLIFWGQPILALWTNDLTLAQTVSPILALLTIGTMMNGYMNVPYMLQLASGWTSFAAWTNAIAVICVLPITLVVVPIYGSIGAASIWALLNAGYFLIGIHFMHKRLMRNQKWRWYLRDILLPTVVVLIVVKGASIFFPNNASVLKTLIFLVLVLFAAYAAALLLSWRVLRAFMVGAPTKTMNS